MQSLIATITADGAFGTPLKGDTLFGQLCWMIRYRQGEPALEKLLDGYSEGRPFAILSDALPEGLAPRPELPPELGADATTRKANRRKQHLPLEALHLALPEAMQRLVETPEHGEWVNAIQPHNSIRRLTGTTGAGSDPFQMPRRWPKAPRMRLDIHVRLDIERLAVEQLAALLTDLGAWGFGRDASLGLGRFQLAALAPAPFLGSQAPDAWLTLAPSAPQGGAWKADRCFWKAFTRFGRHGGEAALGIPFKSPILLADTGAVLTPSQFAAGYGFVGRGLGGDGRISRQIPGTVHQGYAPAIPVKLGLAA